MKKRLLILPFAMALLFTMPVESVAAPAIEIIDNEVQEVSVTVNSSTIHVVGANGETLYVYNVAGVRVMAIKVDGSDRHYDLNLPKGCYIVKIGKFVRKISVNK
ncbi:MAG: T9SS type A sorting domain-containing protein [Prevotellaceae bacterium]|nr:T9SS type A sorting domain-containing protein [Prevotellaceae bacterium]